MKIIKSFLKTFIVLLFVVMLVVSGYYFAYLYQPKGTHSTYAWTNEDEFDIYQNTSVVQKDPNKDFVILNLADIQLSDFGDLVHRPKIRQEINELVKRTNPDLITLTGDQVWSDQTKNSLSCLVKWLDGYKIPWAPVFGNHDDEGNASFDYMCDVYESSKYCLFNRGPANLGCLGNYVVIIMEGEKVYKSLYMLNLADFDAFTDKQLEWIEWNAEKIKNFNGEQPEAMCFFHKPIDQFRWAYNAYKSNPTLAIGEVYNFDGSSYLGQGRDAFELFKSINVKDVVCGHQHSNAFTINYEGVRLTYSLKTGELCYFHSDDNVYLNGATTFTLSGNTTQVKMNFVDEKTYHIQGSSNE